MPGDLNAKVWTLAMPQKPSSPPFHMEGSVALAYVTGRHTPPATKRNSRSFLGIYLSKAEPRLSFWTIDRSGRQHAFSMASESEVNIEYTLILGWLWYEIPFNQWRLFELKKSELSVLKKVDLHDDYDDARKRLCSVLYQSRLGIYFGLPKLKPMFSIHQRSVVTIGRDLAERAIVLSSVGLR